MRRETVLEKRDVALLLLLTALTLLGYQFGIGNQVEQFPIIGRIADPDFLKGDFYVDSAVGFGPRYYYSVFVSLLVRVGSLPAVIAFLSCAAGFGVAAISFIACKRHFGAAASGAAVAAAFAILNNSFSLGLAGYIRFDSFQPASLAIPLSFAGLYLLIDGRRFAAATSFAASAVFHPLIGVEIAMVGYAACAVAEVVARRPMSALFAYIPSGLFFSALVFLFWIMPGLGSNAEAIGAEEFFAILPTFRSPHHYLAATFPLAHYASALTFSAVVVYLGLRAAGATGRDFRNAAYFSAALIVVALCIASAFFVDVLHERIFSTAQVFRNLLLLKWIGFLYFGALAGRWIETRRLLFLISPFAALVATGDAQPYVMALAVVATEIARRRPDDLRLDALLAALIAVAAIALTWKLASHEAATRALVGAGILAAFFAVKLPTRTVSICATVAVAALLLVGWENRRRNFIDVELFRPTYSWDDLQGPPSRIARWARQNSEANSLWLTPPGFENFRLIAERPVLVDYTSIPFDGGAMREWRRRMEILYGPVSGTGFGALRSMEKNFRSISEKALTERAREFGADYAVLYKATPWSGPVLYENERYKAVDLRR